MQSETRREEQRQANLSAIKERNERLKIETERALREAQQRNTLPARLQQEYEKVDELVAEVEVILGDPRLRQAQRTLLYEAICRLSERVKHLRNLLDPQHTEV